MPRTKRRSVKKRKSDAGKENRNFDDKNFYEKCEAWFEDCDKQFKMSLSRIKLLMDSKVTELEDRYNVLKVKLGRQVLKSKIIDDGIDITDILNNINASTVDSSDKVVTTAVTPLKTPAREVVSSSRRTRNLSLTESQMSFASQNSRTSRRSVSADSSRKVNFSSDPPMSSEPVSHTMSKFMTPANQMIFPRSADFTITPKVQPNAQISIYRHPQQGEFAVSMQGSPLLITSAINCNAANVNVPLKDGKVLSILPRPCISKPQDIPELDEVTRNQLAALQENLRTILEFTEKK